MITEKCDKQLPTAGTQPVQSVAQWKKLLGKKRAKKKKHRDAIKTNVSD